MRYESRRMLRQGDKEKKKKSKENNSCDIKIEKKITNESVLNVKCCKKKQTLPLRCLIIKYESNSSLSSNVY